MRENLQGVLSRSEQESAIHNFSKQYVQQQKKMAVPRVYISQKLLMLYEKVKCSGLIFIVLPLHAKKAQELHIFLFGGSWFSR